MKTKQGISNLRIRLRKGVWVATWEQEGEEWYQEGESAEDAVRGLMEEG
jgi:hypothetical protein